MKVGGDNGCEGALSMRSAGALKLQGIRISNWQFQTLPGLLVEPAPNSGARRMEK